MNTPPEDDESHDHNRELSEAIHKAINDFDIEGVQRALQNPALDIDETWVGVTPLAAAIEKENYPIVELLLESGANINTESYSGQYCTMERPIVAAARVFDKNIFNLLINQRCNIDLSSDGHKDALQWAATHGDIQMVEDLLKLGADVNWIGRSGFTALHYAASGGHRSIVKMLLQKNAEITVNYEWRSPVHLACLNSKTDVLKELLKKTPSINIKDRYNQTPLSLAALGNNLNLIQELYPLLITQVDQSELHIALDTALSSSIRGTAVKSATYLLQKGANPNLIGLTGMPLVNEVCRTRKKDLGKQLLKLLLHNGARLDKISDSQIILLYHILFDLVEMSFMDILLYHGADVIDQDLNKVTQVAVLLQVDLAHLRQVSYVIRCKVGSMYHDATLWKLFRLSRISSISDGFPEDESNQDEVVLHILSTVPSLSALSRSCVRRTMSVVTGGRTIVPLIHKIGLPIPQGIIKYLLLADVIQEDDVLYVL